ncbi:MAG: glycosyltransferase [Isosphaeraceae bacterium]
MNHLLRRVKRNLRDFQSLRELTSDWTWQLSPAHVPPVEPTWRISSDELRGACLHWPTTYQWEKASGWVRNLLAGFQRLLPVRRVALPQTYERIVLIQLASPAGTHDVVLDYSDYLDEVHAEALDRSLVYFKMQYRREGYGDARIVPGGYVNYSKPLYRYLRRLRVIKDQAAPTTDVYGRFGMQFASETRARAVAMLGAQSTFGFTGSTRIVRHGQSLREVARSRICIDLPGNGDFCFRLTDYLAVGACIIGPPHRTAMHVPLVDREHLVHCKPDLSDLVSLCQHYLDHEGERDRITSNAREFFDRYLHRDQLAAYYLRTALDRAGNSGGPGAG